MFGKKVAKKSKSADWRDFRTHDRQAMRGLRATVNSIPAEMIDYSSGGMRVRANEQLPRVGTVEILEGRKLVRAVVAVVAWSRNSETGYMFRNKQKLSDAPRRVVSR